MSVFTSDKGTVKLYRLTFLTKITPNLNISARMSWSIWDILKPFKKLVVVYYQVYKLWANSPRVFKPDNTLLLVYRLCLLQIKKAVKPVGLG